LLLSETGSVLRGLEIKGLLHPERQTWGDTPPLRHQIQCQISMACVGVPWTLFALVGGQEKEYQFEPDKELQDMLIEKCRRFWFDNVLEQIPPASDGSDGDTKAINQALDAQHNPIVRVGADVENLVFAYKTALQVSKDAATEAERLKQEIITAIGYNDGIQGPWGKATYKRSASGSKRFYVKFVNE